MVPGLSTARLATIGQYLAVLCAIALIYFVLAKLGLMLVRINPSASPVWPPTGFALAVVLLRGYHAWPALFVGALVANYLSAGTIYTPLAIASGTTLEALVGGYLINGWCGGKRVFNTPGDVAGFALTSVGPATLLSASLGVGALRLAGYVEAANFAAVWTTWWMGDFASALLLTPVIVLWPIPDSEPRNRDDLAKSGLLYLAASVVGLVAFSPIIDLSVHEGTLGFLAMAPLLWAALRRGQRDTATVGLILACFAVWGASAADISADRATQNDSFLLVSVFVIGAALPSLALSAEVTIRKEAEKRQRLLIAELNHRVKNTLATVQAIANQTLGASTIPAFNSRLQAPASAHTLLTRSRWQGADLRAPVADQLALGDVAVYTRISCTGPVLSIEPQTALHLGLVLHELGTNARKYRALSVPGGRLRLNWRINSQASRDVLQIDWIESGGPTVSVPKAQSKGFGATLIEQSLEHSIGGATRLSFLSTGVTCWIHVPLKSLRSAPPSGELLHEVKFDGWRIQLHKHGRSAATFTKNGHDYSSRVRWMVDALARIPPCAPSSSTASCGM
jgi:two-component sensor histidine kinase